MHRKNKLNYNKCVKGELFFGKVGNHSKAPGFRVLVTQGTEGFEDFGTRALGQSIGV